MNFYARVPKFSSRRLVSASSGSRNLPQSTGSEAFVNSNIAGLRFLGTPANDNPLSVTVHCSLFTVYS